MTLKDMCALALPMCSLGADPGVREAVATLARMTRKERTPAAFFRLAREMGRHATEAEEVFALLGGSGTDICTISQCFDQEALAFFHLCGQCSADELLAVLTRCTVVPTARGLAMLISRQRRREAMARYGLQLLWRICGDAEMPDALALFPEERDARSADEVIHHLTHRLKGGERDA